MGIIRFSALWNDQGKVSTDLILFQLIDTTLDLIVALSFRNTHTLMDMRNYYFKILITTGVGEGAALLTEQKISNKFIFIVNYEL